MKSLTARLLLVLPLFCFLSSDLPAKVSLTKEQIEQQKKIEQLMKLAMKQQAEQKKKYGERDKTLDYEELGRVKWKRDYEGALKRSAENKKPVFLLFDEVPGCQGCKKYGKYILSNPLFVDMIEQEFEPLFIFNNRNNAYDTKILRKYKEKPWSYPMVHFVDSEGKDIAPKASYHRGRHGLMQGVAQVYKKTGRKMPLYVDLLLQSSQTKKDYETATFAMGCFWTGERKLGKIDGVVSSKIGFLKGHEVVELKFRPSVVSYTSLVEKAKDFKCANAIFARTDKQMEVLKTFEGLNAIRTDDAIKPSHHQFDLKNTFHYYLPLSEIQATKLNACGKKNVVSGRYPKDLLTPTQNKLLEKMKALPKDSHKALKQLKVDRSKKGLPGYWMQLEKFLDSQSKESATDKVEKEDSQTPARPG